MSSSKPSSAHRSSSTSGTFPARLPGRNDLDYEEVLGATAETDRTGLQLWAAALVLSHWLVEEKELLQGKSVCALGDGCGMCGIVAARHCGAAKVLVTDLAEPTMDNMRYNLALNGLGPDAAGEAAATAGEAAAPVATAATLDWFKPESWPAPVEVLVGSDLVYSTDAVPHLLKVRDRAAPAECGPSPTRPSPPNAAAA